MTIYCLQPANKGHLLILPKRHIEHFSDLNQTEILTIQKEINLLSNLFKDCYETPDFFIMQKNEKKAGQTIDHIHFHIISTPESIHSTMKHAINYRDTLSNAELRTYTEELKSY